MFSFLKSCNLYKGFSFEILEKTREKNKGLEPGFLQFRAHDPVDHQTALEIQKTNKVVVSYLSCSQIRLDPTVDSCQCDYTTKVKNTRTLLRASENVFIVSTMGLVSSLLQIQNTRCTYFGYLLVLNCWNSKQLNLKLSNPVF